MSFDEDFENIYAKGRQRSWKDRFSFNSYRRKGFCSTLLFLGLIFLIVPLFIGTIYHFAIMKRSFDSASLKSLYEQYQDKFESFGYSGAVAEETRANATIVSLVRNEELWKMVDSIRDVEDRFNGKYHYDWVFLNEEEFTDEFKRVTANLVSGEAKYGKIPRSEWSFPDDLDIPKYEQSKQKLVDDNVIYGGLDSYRHMCRYNSGFFYKHPLLQDYQWYWRVEPNIKIYCDVNYDPFTFMIENNKTYGFVMALKEFEATIPTLWKTTKEFIQQHPEYVPENNLQQFVSRDGLRTYNLCHFWSNFEIANMDFFRSQTYEDYFQYLDSKKGFFYERWGDAPVHSIAASLFLEKDQIHLFNDFGYYHNPYGACPMNQEIFIENRCSCDYTKDFTFSLHSCAPLYYDIQKLEKPEGWRKKVRFPAPFMEN
ncbi:hypothetical protein DASC09_016680 [Saccharomycopsis crataegensis]|uniref:Uncharacterized protein n=1 Tax=Saccharomycopsis crataegensis TaxID=43959 RepID=A0AAV5QHT5_9ASCO|nr:hypothetical protein DASC09_016680 [Saccharomycopsis crataegensis]